MVRNYILWEKSYAPDTDLEKYVWYNEGICKIWNGYMWVIVNQDTGVLAEELIPLTIARKTDLINLLRNLPADFFSGDVEWINKLEIAIASKLDTADFDTFKKGLENRLNGFDTALYNVNGELLSLNNRITALGNRVSDLENRDSGSGGGSGDSGSGSGQKGDKGDTGEAGRSIVSVDLYFKLSSLSDGVRPPGLAISDPTSSVGGSWSKTSLTPTANSPYLWCFTQVTYDKALVSGYIYSRSNAYIIRSFNSNTSAEYDSLEEQLNELKESIRSSFNSYNDAIAEINRKLKNLTPEIEGDLSDQLDDLNDRLDDIDSSDVALIRDNSQGLWGVLTSYRDSSNPQKVSFADILANARNAEIALKTGAHFFGLNENGYPYGGETSANLTLNALTGEISTKATKAELQTLGTNLTNLINGASFSVSPALISALVDKGTICWKDTEGKLHPYTLHMTDYDSADHFELPTSQESEDEEENQRLYFVEYEKYMTCAQDASGCPSDGPFERAIIVDEFSNIAITAESIESSVNKYKFMWREITSGTVYNYEQFESDYNLVKDSYSSYEDYVLSIRESGQQKYEKVEIGNVLSNITQTAEYIRSQVGDMRYYWRKLVNGDYQYEIYQVPANETRNDYENYMQNTGWELMEYAAQLSTIEQNIDSITSYVDHKDQIWIWNDSNNQPPTDADYSRPYDYWLTEYENNKQSEESYLGYVSRVHSSYDLIKVATAISRIKQTADNINISIDSVEGLEKRLNAIEVNSESIGLIASKGYKYWRNKVDTEDIKLYDYFTEDYNNSSDKDSFEYEEWVVQNTNYELINSLDELGQIKVASDNIIAALYDNSGNLKAGISIIANAEQRGSAIVLSSDKVQIEGVLTVGDSHYFDEEGKFLGTQIAGGSITTDQIDVNNLIAGIIDTGSLYTTVLTVQNNGKTILNSGSNLQYPLLCGSDININDPSTASTRISSNGTLYANGAEIIGTIHANDGSIDGNLIIGSNGCITSNSGALSGGTSVEIDNDSISLNIAQTTYGSQTNITAEGINIKEFGRYLSKGITITGADIVRYDISSSSRTSGSINERVVWSNSVNTIVISGNEPDSTADSNTLYFVTD